MENSLQKIIAMVIGVLMFFIIPVYIAFEKVDDISYSLIVKFTHSFVDNVREKGYISPEMYGDFIKNIYSTDNTYDVQIEHIKKRYDPVIYIYDKKGEIIETLDYEKYKTQYVSTVPAEITVGNPKMYPTNPEQKILGPRNDYTNYSKVDSTKIYKDGVNCVMIVAHSITEERITDKQIIQKLFAETTITKDIFIRNYMSGNTDLYKNLAYIDENSYTFNEGDKINVIVKNTNKTIASTFYGMFTANIGNEDISKVYVNYGGSIRNSGTTILKEENGNIYSNIGRLFKYKGIAEEITLPQGKYEVESWGASGGGTNGGKGAYTRAVIELLEQKTFYVYVGGTGREYSETDTENGGWNGGGNSYKGYGGGGASDIRLVKGENDNDTNNMESLLSRIMVTAGGGGSSSTGGTGGFGSDINQNAGPGGGSGSYRGKEATHGNTVIKNGAGFIYEDGTIGKGGRSDYLGSGAGGAGLVGGSASHNNTSGGGGGLSYIYKNKIYDDSTQKKIWLNNTEVIATSTFLNQLYSGTGANMEWLDITVSGIESKRGGLVTESPMSSLNTSNIQNGYVKIKKVNE